MNLNSGQSPKVLGFTDSFRLPIIRMGGCTGTHHGMLRKLKKFLESVVHCESVAKRIEFSIANYKFIFICSL